MTTHPLADARERQEASKPKAQLSELIYQGIIARLEVGPVHADDLESIFPVGERAACRKLVGGQFGSLVKRRYIYETERRKSKMPSRNAGKSGVFEFTRLGRETLARVSLGTPQEQSSDGPRSPSVQGCAKADSGEARGGSPRRKARPPEPARLFEDDPEGKPPLAYDPYERGQAA